MEVQKVGKMPASDPGKGWKKAGKGDNFINMGIAFQGGGELRLNQD